LTKSVHLINEDNINVLYYVDYNKFSIVKGVIDKEILKEENVILNQEKLVECIPNVDERLKKLTLVVTSNCNLKCKYCFADYVHKSSHKTMSANTFKNAIDFILRNYPKGCSNITIFGGEPLLAFNVIKEGIEYYDKKCDELSLIKGKISIVTNGTIINHEIIDFLNSYDNISVTFSLDGSREINDFARIDKKSKGVYGKVSNNIKANKDKFKFITNIEVTLNKEHVKNYKKGEAKKWIKELLDLGVNGITVGVVESKNEELGLQIEDEYIYKQMYSEIVDYLFEEILNGRVFISSDIIEGIKALVSKKIIPISCTAAINNLTIGAEGDILPCYTFYGEKECIMGNVIDDISEKYYSIQNKFKNDYYEKPEDCRSCWIRNICNVWCRGLNNASNKNPLTILKPRCWTGQILYERIILNLAKLSSDKRKYEIFKENLRVISTTYRLVE
jgi:uncharacterized protein